MKYKLSNGKMVDVVSAEGTKGCLLRGMDNKPTFRVYREDYSFEDFDIYHEDMDIVIQSGVCFYRTEDGKVWLDHHPDALGLNKVGDSEDEK